MKRAYWRRVGDTLSQSLNTAIFNGDPDESTSGRSYKYGVLLNKRSWFYLMKFIDGLFYLFEKDHCKNAYFYDLKRIEERLIQEKTLLKEKGLYERYYSEY